MGVPAVLFSLVSAAYAALVVDTDGDGVVDAVEVELGMDPTLCDTDGDGLLDATEIGYAAPAEGSAATCFAPDADPGTTTNPTVPDSDRGGTWDGDEDRDHNGEVGPWETDPGEETDDEDSDGDGVAEVLEARCALAGTSTDHDGDGVEDTDEGLVDADGDGLPGFCDADDDDDGIPTAAEGTGDTDGDGTPDRLDTDADDDGTPDGDEGLDDLDCDGLPDFQDANDVDGGCSDPDQDGLDNDAEQACGSDPNDADSDGDGVPDRAESCENDADCDLLPDRLDAVHDVGLCARVGEPSPAGTCLTGDAFLDCGTLGGGSCAAAPSPVAALGALAGLLCALRGGRR